MKIVYSDLYNKKFVHYVNEGLVAKVIEAPDNIKDLQLGEDLFRISVKSFPADAPYSVLSLHSISGDERTVFFAIRIYHDLQNGIEKEQPVRMLEIFLKTFGLNIKSKHKKQKLIFHNTQSLEKNEDMSKLVTIVNPHGKNFAASGFTKVEQDGTGHVAQIFYYFAIDTDEYGKWLSRHSG